jgi:hypothetical protein
MHTDFKATNHFNLRYLSMLMALLALFIFCASMTRYDRTVVTGESHQATPSRAAAVPLDRAG